MSFHYEPSDREKKIMDVLTDEHAGMRLAVSRTGAEMVSLALRDPEGIWRGFLIRDGELSRPPTGWGNHATVMGYFIHRLKNQRTTYRGREMRGGTHGFLRHHDFSAPQTAITEDRAALSYRIEPGQIEEHEYPLHVALTLTYTLEAGMLHTRFYFENLEPELTAHVSFGLHPGFAVESLESCEVILPPGRYVRHLAPGDFLSGETETIVHGGGPMPFEKSELPGSFLLEIVEVQEPIFIVRDRTRQTDLDFSEVPFVTLWSDGGSFVCVEPCWGLPDHQEQRPFEAKLGIQQIPARGTLEREFTIMPRLR